MSSLPPLHGDSDGRYRVQILGNSGSGKGFLPLACSLLEQSSTGNALAAVLGVSYISMDRLFWNPGWVKSSREEFEAKLRKALEQDERGWVVDGNYTAFGGGIAADAATDIIWLDPPLYVYFPRIVLRTFLRLIRLRAPCSPGCEEKITEVFFSKKSILWWCLSQHRRVRERNEEKMKLISIDSGSDVSNRKMRRFGGWGSDVKAWLREVAEMVSAGKQD